MSLLQSHQRSCWHMTRQCTRRLTSIWFTLDWSNSETGYVAAALFYFGLVDLTSVDKLFDATPEIGTHALPNFPQVITPPPTLAGHGSGSLPSPANNEWCEPSSNAYHCALVWRSTMLLLDCKDSNPRVAPGTYLGDSRNVTVLDPITSTNEYPQRGSLLG